MGGLKYLILAVVLVAVASADPHHHHHRRGHGGLSGGGRVGGRVNGGIGGNGQIGLYKRPVYVKGEGWKGYVRPYGRNGGALGGLGFLGNALSDTLGSASYLLRSIVRGGGVNTFEAAWNVIIRLGASIGHILNASIPGLGTLFANLVLTLARSLVCANHSLFSFLGSLLGQRNGICGSGYGSGLGFKLFNQNVDASNAGNMLGFYKVRNPLAVARRLIRLATKGRGLAGLSVNLRIIVRSILRLAGLFRVNPANWTQSNLASALSQILTILGVYGNGYYPGLGNDLVKSVFNSIIRPTFKSRFPGVLGIIPNILSLIAGVVPSTFNGALKSSDGFFAKSQDAPVRTTQIDDDGISYNDDDNQPLAKFDDGVLDGGDDNSGGVDDGSDDGTGSGVLAEDDFGNGPSGGSPANGPSDGDNGLGSGDIPSGGSNGINGSGNGDSVSIDDGSLSGSNGGSDGTSGSLGSDDGSGTDGSGGRYVIRSNGGSVDGTNDGSNGGSGLYEDSGSNDDGTITYKRTYYVDGNGGSTTDGGDGTDGNYDITYATNDEQSQ